MWYLISETLETKNRSSINHLDYTLYLAITKKIFFFVRNFTTKKLITRENVANLGHLGVSMLWPTKIDSSQNVTLPPPLLFSRFSLPFHRQWMNLLTWNEWRIRLRFEKNRSRMRLFLWNLFQVWHRYRANLTGGGVCEIYFDRGWVANGRSASVMAAALILIFGLSVSSQPFVHQYLS